MIRWYRYYVPAYFVVGICFILIASKSPKNLSVLVKVTTEESYKNSRTVVEAISASDFQQDVAIKNIQANRHRKVLDRKFAPFSRLLPRYNAIFKQQKATEPKLSTTIVPNTIIRSGASTKLPLCPESSPFLVGFKAVATNVPSWENLERTIGPTMEDGGVYRPHGCLARRKVAIVVPYRDREEHLRSFLQHMHPFLQRQQTEYAIFIVEQKDNAPFNRGKLLNIGVVEALRQFPYDCFIFHDVDFLPEDDRTVYGCQEQPLSFIGTAAKGNASYKPYYRAYFGGVSSLNKQQIFMVNGFSNEYWGWGSEDDDMYRRITHHNLTVARYPAEIAPYRMMKHVTAKANNKRFFLLARGKMRMEIDGLSNLAYQRLLFSKRSLCTWISVDLQFNTSNTKL